MIEKHWTFAIAFSALAACNGTGTPDAGSDGGPLDAIFSADSSDGAPNGDTIVQNDASAPQGLARHSGSIAISPDGMHVYVANADADSVSIINTATRMLEHEVLLGSSHPMQDPTTREFTPAYGPRALALSPTRGKLYVSEQRAGDLAVIDLVSLNVTHIPVGSEPAGVLVSFDEQNVYVACAQDATVVRIDASSLAVNGTAALAPIVPPLDHPQTTNTPWALAWSHDGSVLFATHLLFADTEALTAGISMIDPVGMTVARVAPLTDIPIGPNNRISNGQIRGLYDISPRPNSNELWVPHLLLATANEQEPANQPTGSAPSTLVFNTTVFPAVTVLHDDGTFSSRFTPADNNNGNVTSGPHAIDFTPDGRYGFVLDTNSEDVMVIDTANPSTAPTAYSVLPGNMPEGLVAAPDGMHLYVDERNTHDVAVLDFDPTSPLGAIQADGNPIERLTADPMPAELRLGQNVFYTANDNEIPVTQNHWVACASCHIEGRSDAVTWRFSPGPRDTPSNAGGTLQRGFLFHTADRNTVMDYSQTIVIEQGGTQFNSNNTMNPTIEMYMQALTDYVNLAIPLPTPPRVDAARAAMGSTIFNDSTVGCSACHSGPAFTDSGYGSVVGSDGLLELNPTPLLHDVGTCNTGVFPDVPHQDFIGDPRQACMFNTQSLRGIAQSAPYFHDGSAPTLQDALVHTRGTMGDITGLSNDQLTDLIEYLRSL